MKKSKLYTRTGDSGTTALVSGNRVSKTHIRIEAYGTIDELNSHIGLIASQPLPDPQLTQPMLTYIQHKLFDLGAYLATDPDAMPPQWHKPEPPAAADTRRIEEYTDTIDNRLPPLTEFVLPGGTPAAAMTHVARTVCRRAERRILTLAAETPVNDGALQFINRLSDFLFAFARFCNTECNQPEIFWNKNC